MVMQLPEGDRYSMNFQQMTSRLAILMGGRVAEELILGKEKITSGASNDIQAATGLARNMVTRWGYSEELGTVSYGDNQEEVFLGHSVARTQNVSEDTAQKIDAEVRRLVQAGLDEARRILKERIEDLHTLAKALLEYETLSGDEIVNALKGIMPNREEAEPRAPARGGRGICSAQPPSSRRADSRAGVTPVRPRPRVMGIVNLTLDSFSGDGCGADLDRTLGRARRLVAEGADLLDLGGGVDTAGRWSRRRRMGNGSPGSGDPGAQKRMLDPHLGGHAQAGGRARRLRRRSHDLERHFRPGAHPASSTTAADLGGEVVLMHMSGAAGDDAGGAPLRRRGRRGRPIPPRPRRLRHGGRRPPRGDLARSGDRLWQDDGA